MKLQFYSDVKITDSDVIVWYVCHSFFFFSHNYLAASKKYVR